MLNISDGVIIITSRKNSRKGNKWKKEMELFNETETSSWVDQLQNVSVELPIFVRQIDSQSFRFSLDRLDCNSRGPIMYVY